MTNVVIRDYLAEAEEAAKPARNLLLDLARYTNYMRTVVREMLPYFPKDDPRYVGFNEAAQGIEPAHVPADFRRKNICICPKAVTRSDCPACGDAEHRLPDEPPGQ